MYENTWEYASIVGALLTASGEESAIDWNVQDVCADT